MKLRSMRKSMSVLLAAALLLGLLPTAALAEEPIPCAITQGCTLADGHEGECVTEPGEGEKETACTLTEGCTLADGHEGECVTELPAVDGALVKTIISWT